jgi:phosphomevalonate kinase
MSGFDPAQTEEWTHAINRATPVLVPVKINATRNSFIALASRLSLSYFSYTTGTASINEDMTSPATDMNTANPVKPAAMQRQ